MKIWFTCGSINAGGQMQGCGRRHRLHHSALECLARVKRLNPKIGWRVMRCTRELQPLDPDDVERQRTGRAAMSAALRAVKGRPGCCVDRVYEDHGFQFSRGCGDDTCMTLPEGMTCGACVHENRCVAIFGAKPENTTCGFFPRRFRKAPAPAGDGGAP